MVPVVDIVEIGAGGGSASPGSTTAGAFASARGARAPSPGPPATAGAATQPTVTDAKLAAGVLDPDYFLGGRLRLAARAGPETRCAARRRRSDLAPGELANGIIRLVEREHDQRAQARLRAARPRPARLRAGRRRRRGSDARGRARRRASGQACRRPAALRRLFRLGNGPRRSAGGCAQTRVLEASTSTAPELDAVFTELEREVTAALVAEGADAGLAPASSDRPTCATAARNTQCACRSRAARSRS